MISHHFFSLLMPALSLLFLVYTFFSFFWQNALLPTLSNIVLAKALYSLCIYRTFSLFYRCNCACTRSFKAVCCHYNSHIHPLPSCLIISINRVRLALRQKKMLKSNFRWDNRKKFFANLKALFRGLNRYLGLSPFRALTFSPKNALYKDYFILIGKS